jgi:hypothetical protein
LEYESIPRRGIESYRKSKIVDKIFSTIHSIKNGRFLNRIKTETNSRNTNEYIWEEMSRDDARKRIMQMFATLRNSNKNNNSNSNSNTNTNTTTNNNNNNTTAKIKRTNKNNDTTTMALSSADVNHNNNSNNKRKANAKNDNAYENENSSSNCKSMATTSTSTSTSTCMTKRIKFTEKKCKIIVVEE